MLESSPTKPNDIVALKLDKIEHRLEKAKVKRSSNLLRNSAKLQLDSDNNKIAIKEELVEAEQFYLMNKVITKHLSKEKFVRKMNKEHQEVLQYQITKNQEKTVQQNARVNLRYLERNDKIQ